MGVVSRLDYTTGLEIKRSQCGCEISEVTWPKDGFHPSSPDATLLRPPRPSGLLPDAPSYKSLGTHVGACRWDPHVSRPSGVYTNLGSAGGVMGKFNVSRLILGGIVTGIVQMCWGSSSMASCLRRDGPLG